MDEPSGSDSLPRTAAENNGGSTPTVRGEVLQRQGQSGDAQLELFADHLPAKPHASNAEHGAWARIMPAPAAKRRRYIEPQPPWVHVWLPFDVDRDASWYAAREAGLPEPSILTVNRRNGHGHLLYGLAVPLRMETYGGRAEPVRYAEAIQRGMTAMLQADAGYSGFVCKNPLHRGWATVTSDHLYTLPELHGWIGDLGRYQRAPTAPATGIGRNFDTFTHVRRWATRGGDGGGPLVLQHKADGGTLETWRQACTGAAERYTRDHHAHYRSGPNVGPLHGSECAWIGRSVSRWTWERFTAERYSEIQRERGRGGEAKRAERAERDRRIVALVEQGATWAAVAAALGVGRTTVGRAIRANSTKAISG